MKRSRPARAQTDRVVDTGVPWVILEKVRDFGRFGDFQHPPKGRSGSRGPDLRLVPRDGRARYTARDGRGLRRHMSLLAQPYEPQRFSNVAIDGSSSGSSGSTGRSYRPGVSVSSGGMALFVCLPTRRHAACRYPKPVEPPTHRRVW